MGNNDKYFWGSREHELKTFLGTTVKSKKKIKGSWEHIPSPLPHKGLIRGKEKRNIPALFTLIGPDTYAAIKQTLLKTTILVSKILFVYHNNSHLIVS